MKKTDANLNQRFIEYCVTAELFRGRPRVLAAVSGGADSIVMMNLLSRNSAALGISVTVAHINHMIRPDADADMNFVEKAAGAACLPFVSERCDVPALAAATHESIETVARRARYEALGRIAEAAECQAIATGHSMTDQAETLLMRMIRGTGPLGLSGISDITPDGIVRPMLCLTASEIRGLAVERGWTFVTDSTNSDEYFLRNRIRARLMPLLAEFNPGIEALLSGLAMDAAAVSATIESLVAPMILVQDGLVIARRIESGSALHAYAVREAFRIVTGQPLGLSRTHINALAKMLQTYEGPAELHLPRRVIARSTRRGVEFERVLDGPPPGSASRARRP